MDNDDLKELIERIIGFGKLLFIVSFIMFIICLLFTF